MHRPGRDACVHSFSSRCEGAGQRGRAEGAEGAAVRRRGPLSEARGERGSLRHNIIALLMSIPANQPQQLRNRMPRRPRLLDERHAPYPYSSTTPSGSYRGGDHPRRGCWAGAAPPQLTFFSQSQPLASSSLGPPWAARLFAMSSARHVVIVMFTQPDRTHS